METLSQLSYTPIQVASISRYRIPYCTHGTGVRYPLSIIVPYLAITVGPDQTRDISPLRGGRHPQVVAIPVSLDYPCIAGHPLLQG